MKKFTPVFIILFLILISNSVFSQGIVINEILTSNTTINKDEDGNYQDWVELYNSGTTIVNLSGYGLTDDVLLPYKWTFPNISVDAGQYLIVWCSDKNRIDPGSPLHTNFKISSSGEEITLTNPSGTVVDFVPATVIAQNISYGRLPNGTGNFVFFQNVTPNVANSSQGYSEVLNPPVFSHDSGFLTAGFDLTLSSSESGVTILYTLDGSEPKASNLGGTTYSYKNQYIKHPGQISGPLLTNSFKTLQYSKPITIVDRSSQPNKIAAISTTNDFTPPYIPTSPIFKGTVVRAKVIKGGSLDSPTITKSYYISPLGISKFSLPVVSLSIDEDKLFDYYTGINVAGVDFDNWRAENPNSETLDIGNIANFFRTGRDNEKGGNFSYFIKGTEVLSQDIGIRIHGGSSRDFRNKSLTFYARTDYGDDSMSYPLITDRPFDNYNAIILHNSGNDFNQTMFRDAFCQELMRSLNVFTKGYQPTITFINGEYWGILSLRDKVDAGLFERRYNIPTDQIDIIENQGVLDFETMEGDNVNYLIMKNYIANHSFADQSNYDYITTQLDPENLIDYDISNIFLENTDWPGNNIRYWRKRTSAYIPDAPFGHDGRWRWMAHDMDDTFSISSENNNLNSLAAATDPNGTEWPNPKWSTLFLRKLLENEGFKIQFINRFADLMNTTFNTSRLLTKLEEMKATLAPEAPGQFARWKAPEDDGDWNYFLNQQIKFANERPAFQRNHIRSQFGITSNINATLNVSNTSQGYIKMNTIDILAGTDGISSNPYPWTGIYFSNIPVKIKAVAKPGYVFSHWTGASTSFNPEITITPTTNFSVTAVFEEENVATSKPIYYWMMNTNIENNMPLVTLNTTYKTGSIDGFIQYQSCLVGYPFTSTDLNWRKASMERRNSPTEINYIPEANNNLLFTNSDMKGLQIKEPLQNGSIDNTLIFNFSTSGYKDINLSFASINELTNATAISLEYSLISGDPIWSVSSSFPLTNTYKLFNYDLSSIVGANNNPNLKVRLKFTGTNMTADTGARITFNNISVHGTAINLSVTQNKSLNFSVYPNPFTDIVNIIRNIESEKTSYKLFAIDGKLIKDGILDKNQINFNDLSRGMYLLQLSSDGKMETKKIIKK